MKGADVGMLRVSVLGPLVAERDGERLAIGGERQRTLLALLCASPGGAKGWQLQDELWNGRPPEGALSTLRTYVTRLRRALDQPGQPSTVAVSAGCYRMDLERVSIDAGEFETSLLECIHRPEPDPAVHSERLEAVLAIWRDEPFADTSLTPTLRRESSRLSELYLSGRKELLRAHLGCGRNARVIAAAEDLVVRHPDDEQLLGALMLALYREGRHVEALARAGAHRRRLREEHGVSPGPHLEELERSILRQDPELDAPFRVPAPRTSRSASAPREPPEEASRADESRAERRLASGRSALRLGQAAMAARHFEEGLRDITASDGQAALLRCDLQIGLAWSRLHLRDIEGAAAAALTAADMASHLGDAGRLADAAVAAGYLHRVGSRDPRLTDLCAEALSHLPEEDRTHRAAVLAAHADYQAFGEGDGESAIVTSELALRLAGRQEDRSILHRCLFVHAETLGWTERVSERLLLAERLLQGGRSAGDRGAVCDGLHVRALAKLTLGDREGFEADRQELRRLSSESDFWYPRAFVPLWEGVSAMMDGRWEDVEPAVAALLSHASHEPNMQNLAAGQLFLLRREQGRLAEVRPVLEQHAAQQAAIPAFTAALAMSYMEEGLHADAARLLAVLVDDDVRAPRDLTWTTTVCLLAEVAAVVGDPSRMAVLRASLSPYRGQVVVACKGITCLGAADRYLAVLSAALGDRPDAERHFAAAVRIEQRLASPPLIARTTELQRRWLGS